MSNESIFAGFEEFESEVSGTQIVYGVNVIRVDAEVTADAESGTVAELVERYRTVLNLPKDVVVFVDGVRFTPEAVIPPEARRIEIVRPAGRKGGLCLEQTPKIELADEDACYITIARRDKVEYKATEEVGEMSESLIPEVDLGNLFVIAVSPDGTATIGKTVTRVTRHPLRTEASVRRRAGELTINDILMAIGESPVEVQLNGEELPDGRCRVLEPGDELVIILPGETRQESFETWAAEMRAAARAAYDEACADREAAVETRKAQLEEMSWWDLRVLGRIRGVKLSGLGRTADAIRADILKAEFPELPPEEEFVATWLVEHAPEALEA